MWHISKEGNEDCERCCFSTKYGCGVSFDKLDCFDLMNDRRYLFHQGEREWRRRQVKGYAMRSRHFVESQEREQTPEEKRENAWFPIHIKSVMENKDNICYENGLKTGRV